MRWDLWKLAVSSLLLLFLAEPSPANAADPGGPLKARPVEYVKCGLYGSGFYYIPGTDTCLKIGGPVHLGGNYEGWCQTGEGNPLYTPIYITHPATGVPGGYFNDPIPRSSSIDTRSMSGYGTLRAYLMSGAGIGNNNAYRSDRSPWDIAREMVNNGTPLTTDRPVDEWTVPSGSKPVDSGHDFNWNLPGNNSSGLKLNSPLIGYNNSYRPIEQPKDEAPKLPDFSSINPQDFAYTSQSTSPRADHIDDTLRWERWMRIHNEEFGKEYSHEFKHDDGSSDVYSAHRDAFGNYVEEHHYYAPDWDFDDWDSKDIYTYQDGKPISYQEIDYGYERDHHHVVFISLLDGEVHTNDFDSENSVVPAFVNRALVDELREIGRSTITGGPSQASELKANYDLWHAAPSPGDTRGNYSIPLSVLLGPDHAKGASNGAELLKSDQNTDFGHLDFRLDKIVAPGFKQSFFEQMFLRQSPTQARQSPPPTDASPDPRPTSRGETQYFDLGLGSTSAEEWAVAAAYDKMPRPPVPAQLQVAANLPNVAAQTEAQKKSRSKKGQGALPPAKPQLVLKLFTNKPSLPVPGRAKSNDVGFDQDPVECVADPQGACTMQIAAAERRYFGVPGSDPVFRVDVDIPNSTSIVWREAANASAATLDSVRERMPSLPPEARVKFRQFSIGDKKFTQAMIEASNYNVAADRWKAYLQPAVKPKGANKGRGDVEVVVQDDCGNKLPAPYGDGQPYPSDANSQALPQATIVLKRGVHHRG